MTDNHHDDWILKVLSGIHVGAEVSLMSEETVLGKNEDCDLVLDDVSLGEKHISLRVEDGQIIVRLLDEERPIYVGETRVESGEATLEPFQMITIGALFLTAGPAGEDWPVIDLQQAQKIIAPAHDETLEDPDGETAGDFMELDPPPEADAPSGNRRLRFALLAGVGLVGVALVALLLTLLNLSGSVPAPLSEGETLSEIQRLVQQHGARAEIKTTGEGEGEGEGEESYARQPQVTGYIGTWGDLAAFQAGLAAAGITATVKLTVAREIRDTISLSLKNGINRDPANAVRVTQVRESPGKFLLQGYVVNEAAWRSELETLRGIVPGDGALEDQVQTLKGRLQTLQGMLKDRGLANLQIDPVDNGLLIRKSDLSDRDTEELKKAIVDFVERFDSRPMVAVPWLDEKIPASMTMESQIKLDIEVIGVSLGTSPHITLRDGSKHMVGGELKDGFIIKEITAAHILLSKGGKNHYFPL